MSLALAKFVSILGLIILVGIMAYFIYTKNKERPESEVSRLHINFNSQYTGGYAIISEENIVKGEIVEADGTPRDTNPHKEKNSKHRAERQQILTKKELCEEVPISGHRKIMFHYPDNPEDLSEEIKNTMIGKALMKVIEEKNQESNIVRIQRERIQRDSVEIPEKVNQVMMDALESQKEIIKNLQPTQNFPIKPEEKK